MAQKLPSTVILDIVWKDPSQGLVRHLMDLHGIGVEQAQHAKNVINFSKFMYCLHKTNGIQEHM